MYRFGLKWQSIVLIPDSVNRNSHISDWGFQTSERAAECFVITVMSNTDLTSLVTSCSMGVIGCCERPPGSSTISPVLEFTTWIQLTLRQKQLQCLKDDFHIPSNDNILNRIANITITRGQGRYLGGSEVILIEIGMARFESASISFLIGRRSFLVRPSSVVSVVYRSTRRRLKLKY